MNTSQNARLFARREPLQSIVGEDRIEVGRAVGKRPDMTKGHPFRFVLSQLIKIREVISKAYEFAGISVIMRKVSRIMTEINLTR